MQMVIENLVTRQKKNILTLPQASLSLSSDMLVHWVKVIWAKDGGSGNPWGPTIFFSEKKIHQSKNPNPNLMFSDIGAEN